MYIWTDGACSHNPGPGGWAFIAETGDSDSGYEVETTNQRMEMMALYNALRYSEELPMEKITILTDSAYCCNCYKNKWWIYLENSKGSMNKFDANLLIAELETLYDTIGNQKSNLLRHNLQTRYSKDCSQEPLCFAVGCRARYCLQK